MDYSGGQASTLCQPEVSASHDRLFDRLMTDLRKLAFRGKKLQHHSNTRICSNAVHSCALAFGTVERIMLVNITDFFSGPMVY